MRDLSWEGLSAQGVEGSCVSTGTPGRGQREDRLCAVGGCPGRCPWPFSVTVSLMASARRMDAFLLGHVWGRACWRSTIMKGHY